jgi:hypothetical protein
MGLGIKPYLKAFLAIKPLHTLHVYPPALAPEQNKDATVSIPNAGLGNLTDALA